MNKQLTLIFLSIGAIIGWGCFVLPGDFFLPEAGLLGSTLALAVGAVLMMVVAACFGCLLNSEGVDTVAHAVIRTLGRQHAFIYYWFITLTYLSIVALNANTVSLLARQVLGDSLSIAPLYEVQGWVVYLGEILVVYAVLFMIYLIDSRKGGGLFRLQNLITFLLIGSVAFIAGKGLGDVELAQRSVDLTFGSWSGFLSILVTTPWAFIGFDIIPQVSRSLGVSKRSSFILMYVAILSGLVIYLVMNLVTSLGVGQEIQSGVQLSWATGEAVESLVGSMGVQVLLLAMAMAVLAGVNGFFIGSRQLILEMIRTGVVASKEREESRLNRLITWGIFLVVAVTPWMGRPVLMWIVNMASLGACVSFLYAGVCCFRRFTSIRIRCLAVLCSAIAVVFLALMLVPFSPIFLAKESLLMLLFWCVLGFYFQQKNKSAGHPAVVVATA